MMNLWTAAASRFRAVERQVAVGCVEGWELGWLLPALFIFQWLGVEAICHPS